MPSILFNPFQSCSILFNPFQSVSIRFNLQSHRHRHCLAPLLPLPLHSTRSPGLARRRVHKVDDRQLSPWHVHLGRPRRTPIPVPMHSTARLSKLKKRIDFHQCSLRLSLSSESSGVKVSATHEVIHWSLVAWVSELGEVLWGLCAS